MFIQKLQEQAISVAVRLMVYSHCMRPGPGIEQGTGLRLMGSNILCRNVHTGPRQGQGPEPIVSCCASPVPCSAPGPCPRPNPVHNTEHDPYEHCPLGNYDSHVY